MFKIKELNKISERGLAQLPPEQFTISESEQNPDGIIMRSYQLKESELNPELLAIARAGAGVNNIPVEQCAARGIVVLNTPGANANAVKELVVAGLLLSTRKVIEGIAWVQGLKGTEDVTKAVEAGKAQFGGPELMGKKICVVGLGAIGVSVANIAQSLGMEVLGYDPYMSVDSAWGLSRAINKVTDLHSVLPECDFVTMHMPLLDSTKHMFNDKLFAEMKDGIRIMNFSRAELVDVESLKRALESGKIARYVTDFPNEEILQMENVIAIPHLGASTPESEENCAEMAAKELRDYLLTGSIRNSVNFPSCDLPPCQHIRIMVLHENIPNMIGQITAVISKYGLNIDNMTNKNKGGYAYTIFDVEELPQREQVVNELKGIHSVTKVRVI